MSTPSVPSAAQRYQDDSLLQLFLPCAGQVEPFLASEVSQILASLPHTVQARRAGVSVATDWQGVMRLNLYSRIAQRVLVSLAQAPYRSEDDLYAMAIEVPWERWFTPRQTIKVEVTAHNSPLKSLNFVALRVKDAIADRFRKIEGVRPSVDTYRPDVRIYLHVDTEDASLSLDTSGDPLFKRGWREDKGDAPLKETLAAAMIAASGWQPEQAEAMPFYDPCCGSGTIAIEAAQIACNMAAGIQRRFGFERLLPFKANDWQAMRAQAKAAQRQPAVPIFGSDIAHRMVDFAKRNAERAGVAHALQMRGGDILQRMPPTQSPGVIVMNPPYGTRIDAAGQAGRNVQQRRSVGFSAREFSEGDDGAAFFSQLAAHWKSHFGGWTAWLLTPDMKLPGKLRLKESRRVPMWNGPIDCRLFRFDLQARGRKEPDAKE